MGYKIDFDKNHAMEEMLLELLKRCSFSLDVMERMLERIYNTNCVKCEAAGHLKEFIRDVIMGTMIPATREAINLFADETRYYVYGMYNLDRSLHVKVEEDYFPDLTDRLNGVLGDTMDTLAACRTVMDSIYDILPLEPKSTEAMEAAFEGLYNMENGVQNSFTDYLEEFMVRAGRMQDAVNGAYTLVSERAMGDIHMDEYDGSYRNDASLQELRQTLADVRADIGHTDDAKAAMETMQAEVYQLYDMEEFAEDQLLYIGGIAVGTISMIVAPWATAPLLSFASGAFATLYSVDQADQGNQMYDAVQGWDTDVEIHPVVEIENPVFNMMYHIAGNMALDHSLDVGLQAGNRFMKWRKEMDGLGMPDNVNIAEDVWHMDAGDVNPLNGADDVADMNTGHAGQANTGGVTHLDDADNVAGVNAGCTPQQANTGGVTHLDDADNVAGVSAGHAKQQANTGGVTHLDDADNVAGVSAGHAQQQANVAHIKTGSGTLPQGISKVKFDEASKLLRDSVGDISNDIVVQGSRANGTAKATSDIDIAIRVSSSKFNELISKYFKSPNPGSAKERTMLHAIETGKIQAGEAKLSGLRKQLQDIFGMEVDISIIKQAGEFDNPPFIPFD